MVLQLLDSMKGDVKDMKSSFEQKRESLADELKQYDDQSHSDHAIPEEEKAIESKNLASICEMFQRVCTMAQDRALHRILDTSKAVEDICEQVKSIGLCRYFVNSDHELDTDREKEIIDCLASLVQRHANSSDHGSLCENMIKEFSHRLSNEYRGIWTAMVGDQCLIWSVPSMVSVQGRTGSLKMVAYCTHQSNTTHKLATQTQFRSIIDSEREKGYRSDQELIDKISIRVNEEFGGQWHCAVTRSDRFAFKSSVDRNFLLRIECADKEYMCWKY
jgi:hypothetical protein